MVCIPELLLKDIRGLHSCWSHEAACLIIWMLWFHFQETERSSNPFRSNFYPRSFSTAFIIPSKRQRTAPSETAKQRKIKVSKPLIALSQKGAINLTPLTAKCNLLFADLDRNCFNTIFPPLPHHKNCGCGYTDLHPRTLRRLGTHKYQQRQEARLCSHGFTSILPQKWRIHWLLKGRAESAPAVRTDQTQHHRPFQIKVQCWTP